MAGRFANKVAIVTGGTSGIGASTTALLISEGARVLVADVNAPEGQGEDLAFHAADLTRPDEAAGVVEAAMTRFGRLDVVVNNAGIGCLGETPDLPAETWRRVFAVNVDAVFHVLRHAIPAMRPDGGAIVNVASISGIAGDYGFSAYAASKAAVINYTRTLALDCARDGIRVNALCPGAIAGTAMGVGTHGSVADRQAWLAPIPLGRYGTADEMARVIAFLASDDASYMTGSIVVADGGTTAHTGQPDIPAQQRRRAGDPA